MSTNPMIPVGRAGEPGADPRPFWATILGVVALTAPWMAILGYGAATPTGSDAGLGGTLLVGFGASLVSAIAAVALGAAAWEHGRRRPPVGLVLGLLAAGGWTFPLCVVYLPVAGALAAFARRDAAPSEKTRAAVILALMTVGGAPWLLLLAVGALG